MGSSKALLPYQGQSFLEHLLKIATHPKIGVRRIVLGADARTIAQAVKLQPDEVVINEDWEKGQLTSIQAALRSLPAGTDGMLLSLIDHPLVSRVLVHDLIELFYSSGKPIVLPVFKGRRGHPVIFGSQAVCGIAGGAAPNGRASGGVAACERNCRTGYHRRRLRAQPE